MAKKTNPQPASKNTADSTASYNWLPWALAALAFIIYAIGFGNKMVAMDDHMATTDNPAVTDFNFFNFNLGMYAPVTWLVYAIAYTLGHDAAADTTNPMWFHVFSALIHAANVWLVYRLGRRLQLNGTLVTILAFFFAIHPLQVEAVAWIAAMSTPLYVMFSLLSIDYYVRHTDSGRAWGSAYWIALGLFVVACLAKSAAVALPLSLVVIDAWRGRALMQNWLEKAPFFAVALGFGVLTLISRGNASHLNPGVGVYTAFDRVLMVSHTVWFYLFKTIFPKYLSIWYPFEKAADGSWDITYLLAPPALVAALGLLWWKRREWPNLWYGILFWLANIVFSLPFRTLGEFELRSDRYNYLACIGILALMAALPGFLEKKYPKYYNYAVGTLCLFTLLSLYTTVTRIRDWNSTISLIDKAVAAQGDNFGKAYLWRGMEYGDRAGKGDVRRAMDDFNKAIERNPDLTDAYKYRGAINGVLSKYEESVNDLNEYLRRKPDDHEYRYNRGLSLLNLNRTREAISDFDAVLEKDPEFFRAYRARGNAWIALGDTIKGQADLAEFEKRSVGK